MTQSVDNPVSPSRFDQVIDRNGFNAMSQVGYRDYLFKGEEINLTHRQEDLIMMWVADMAFPAPRAATDAMLRRIEHGVFGYTANMDDTYYNAFNSWTMRRLGWGFEREQLFISSGVIPALFSLVEIVCARDEKVMTLTPAYGFFKHAATRHQRELVTSSLVICDGNYRIDLEDFRQKAADPKLKLFFLCHPHNPTGRVWDREELCQMAEICFENDVLIVSDEVHCDLLRMGNTHQPLAGLYPDSHSIVTCMAPSKTFNLAGMQIANIVIPDPELAERWKERNLPVVNPISLAAARGVYENGEEWLDELRVYLDGNFALVKSFLSEHLPAAKFNVPEATYLAWIDIGSYFPETMNLTRFFAENASVILEGGEMFIANGENRIRLNLACPRSVVLECLKRMRDSIADTHNLIRQIN